MDPAVNMTWRQAKVFAKQYNQAVRRWAWRRWVQYDPNSFLWFSARTDLDPVVSHVAEAPEHTAEDKLAADWTNIPFDGTPPDGPPDAPPLYPPPTSGGTYFTRYTDASPALTTPDPITFDLSLAWTPSPDGSYYLKTDPGPDGIINTTDDIGPDGIAGNDDDLNVSHPACYTSLPDTLGLVATVTTGGGNPLSIGTLTVTIPGVSVDVEVGAPGVAATAAATIPTTLPYLTLFAHYSQPAQGHVAAISADFTRELAWPGLCPP